MLVPVCFDSCFRFTDKDESTAIKPNAVAAPPATNATPADATPQANTIQAAMAAQLAGLPLFPGALPFGFPAYPPINPFVPPAQVLGRYQPYANPYAWDLRPEPPIQGRRSPPPNEYAPYNLPNRGVEALQRDHQPADTDLRPARHMPPALDEHEAVEVGRRRQREEPQTPEKPRHREVPRDFPIIKDWLVALDEGDRGDGRSFAQYATVCERLGLHRIVELTRNPDTVVNRLMGEGMLYGVASAIVDYACEDVEDIRKEKRGQAATPKRQRYF